MAFNATPGHGLVPTALSPYRGSGRGETGGRAPRPCPARLPEGSLAQVLAAVHHGRPRDPEVGKASARPSSGNRRGYRYGSGGGSWEEGQP